MSAAPDHDASGAVLPGPLSPGPTPAGADGAPLRVLPAWWPEAPGDAALERAAAGGTPVVGAEHVVDGVRLREVTFLVEDRAGAPGGPAEVAAEGPDDGEGSQAVMVHLNSLTDRHREDITGALLPRVPGTRWRALTYLLPPDAIVGYRIVRRPAEQLPADIGARREGWMQVHDWGEPDPRNRARLAGAHRGPGSVWTGPEARGHPEWTGAAQPRSGWARCTELGDEDRAITLFHGGPQRTSARSVPEPSEPGPSAPGGTAPRRLLVLLDGETWRALDAERRLADRAHDWDLLLVDSGSREQRSRDLPDPVRAADLVATAVARAGAADAARPAGAPQDVDVSRADGVHWTSDRVVVAGQSFGGLAAAQVALLRPDVAGTGIAQSGSYWHGSDEAPPTGTGTLLRHLAALPADARARGGGRVLLQVGAEEGAMVDGSAQLAALLERTPALLAHQVFRGGHDYAWWRHGLSHALDLLEAGPALDSPT